MSSRNGQYGIDSDDNENDPDDTKLPFNKRRRVVRPDRLSTLPESVIFHILSFLPILDSIRTGVLSRKWQYLWTCVPSLNFDYARIRCDFDSSEVLTSELVDFVELVNKTLVLCDGSVKSFAVTFPYLNRFASNSDLWGRFASRNGVEKFHLEFELSEMCDYDIEDDDDEEHIYTLPQFLYTNSKFRELRFSMCRIEPKKTVAWSSLKELSIGYANLSDDAIQRILAGTPVLEKLELYCFKGIKSLHIGKDSSVERLVLRGSWIKYGSSSYEKLFPLKITAPNLRSLEISGDFMNIQLVNIKSLVEAKLYDINLEDFSYDDLVNQAQSLLDSLAHVKTLTLGTWFIERLALMHTKRVSPRLLKCECLTINTELWESHPLGIVVLLRYFPLLQTLIWTIPREWGLFNHMQSRLRNVEREFSTTPIPFDGLRLLRTVKLFHFWKYRHGGFEFVKIMLKNAMLLQKMTVHMGTRNDYNRDPNELFKASQKLLSFTRASPGAQVLVYE